MRHTIPSTNGHHTERRHSRSRPRFWQHSILFYVVVAAALLAFIEGFSLLSPIILSFLLTIFITLALNPLVMRLRAFVGGRKVATACISLGVLVVLGLAILAFFGPLGSSASKLSEQLPEYWARLQKPLVKMEQRTAESEAKLQAEVAAEAAHTNAPGGQTNAVAASAPVNGVGGTETNAAGAKPPAKGRTAVARSQDARAGGAPAVPPERSSHQSGSLRSGLTQSLQGIAGRFAGFAFNAAQFMVVLITVFFGVTFTLMNPRPVFRAIFALVPQPHHQTAQTVVKRMGEFLPHWALSTLTAMLSVGLLVFLLMWPLLGFPSALILGAIAGTFEAIPYVGPILSAVPAVLFALGKGGLTPVWVCLLYMAVQLLENNVIIPLVMSRGMKLHSVPVLFSLLVCAVAFGVLGVLVAAPLVAVMQVLHDEIYRKRFLPAVTDAELDQMARSALGERQSAGG